ncbi:MAG: hypothetical protein MK171_03355 [Pirellulales bacterium]|nr:hypothetical protein [Pirellulales bacterium]
MCATSTNIEDGAVSIGLRLVVCVASLLGKPVARPHRLEVLRALIEAFREDVWHKKHAT